MRAAWYDRFGAAREVIQVGEYDTPLPNEDEVRVHLRASGINSSDIYRRKGGGGYELGFPLIIPHMDGAGIIDVVGKGVPASRLGERVWVYEAQYKRQFGTAAEYCTVPSRLAVTLPATIDFDTGASLGVPAMTAHRALFSDGPIVEQTILVNGGAGAVGNFAIQLAKWGRAKRVIATVSSTRKSELAYSAGADHVLNYKLEDISRRVREITSGDGVDRIVEVAFRSNLRTNISLLKKNGVIATYDSDSDSVPDFPFIDFLQHGITAHFILVYIMPEAAHKAAVNDITDALKRKNLRTIIARRFSLDEIVEAHENLEKKTAIGKVLITFN